MCEESWGMTLHAHLDSQRPGGSTVRSVSPQPTTSEARFQGTTISGNVRFVWVSSEYADVAYISGQSSERHASTRWVKSPPGRDTSTTSVVNRVLRSRFNRDLL